jgi:thiol:disulfide interchange protein
VDPIGPGRGDQSDRHVDATPTAGTWGNAARIGFGGFFLAMAAYNTTVVLPNAAETLAGVPLTLLLIAFEVGVAVLVLSKGRRVRAGLLAAVAFMIGLAPLMSWYELAKCHWWPGRWRSWPGTTTAACSTWSATTTSERTLAGRLPRGLRRGGASGGIRTPTGT